MLTVDYTIFKWDKKKKILNVNLSLINEVSDHGLQHNGYYAPFFYLNGIKHKILFTYSRTLKNKTFYHTNDVNAKGIKVVIHNDV